MIKKYLLNTIPSVRSLFLALVAVLVSLNLSAQTITINNEPDGIDEYTGEDEDELEIDNLTDPFPAGTTFILYHDTFEEENELASFTSTSATQAVDFVWPDINGTVNLFVGAFSGDVYEAETVDIDVETMFLAGADASESAYPVDFYRAGARYLITEPYEIDFDETVILSVDLDLSSVTVDNQINVQVSTDGGTNYSSLTDIGGGNSAFDFSNDGFLTFDFALTGVQTVQFRVIQPDSPELAIYEEQWDVDFMEINIGDVYAQEVAPVALTGNSFTVVRPTLNSNLLENTDGPVNINGGTVYPSEEVEVNAELAGVTPLTKYSYEVLLWDEDDNYHFLDNLSINASASPIVATGDIPLDAPYGDYDVEIVAYEGASIQVGLLEDLDLSTTDADDFTVVGGEQTISGIEFSESGDRHITSPAYNVSTATDSYLAIWLGRLQDELSPSGTDLIIEFSTDGSSFSELMTVPLNSLPNGNKEILIEDLSAAISSSTWFRVRQEGNNGLDLDGWIATTFELNVGSNIVSDNLTHASSLTVEILAPAIVLDPIEITLGELAYPMTELDVDFHVAAGEFPAGTTAQLLLARGGDAEYDILLESDIDITAGHDDTPVTVSFAVPPIEAGDYNIYLNTDNGVESNAQSLAVYDLDIEITDIVYNDPVPVDEDDWTYPGGSITVNYTMGGTPGAGAELVLSVWNDDTDEYDMIGATTTFNGSITATLPTDNDYGPDPEIMIGVAAGVYSSGFTVNIELQNWYFNPAPEGFVIEGEETYSGAETALVSEGVRSVTTPEYDISQGGQLHFNYRTMVTSSPVTIRIEGSTDSGATWVEFDEHTINTSVNNWNSGWFVIPRELWSDATQFRMIYNEDGSSGYEEDIVQIYYFRIYGPEFFEVVGDAHELRLLYPALDITILDETNFIFAEDVAINYNAQGFPAGTEYAAVIEQDDDYFVLGTSNGQGASSIAATMPNTHLDLDDPNENYDLIIVPFMPATAGGDYIQGTTEVLDDDDDDFPEIEGDVDGGDGSFDFDDEGERFTITREIDLSDAETVYLNFAINFPGHGNIDIMENQNVIPRLEASTDGTTWTLIPVEELAEGEVAMYDEGYLYEEKTYAAPVPSGFFGATTQFRWSQPLNLGYQENRWDLNNVSVTINRGNAVPDFIYTDTNNDIAITIDAPDLANYNWSQADLQDAVFNGETFDYIWEIDPDSDGKPFPDGTVFTFTLQEQDPVTARKFVVGQNTGYGTFTSNTLNYQENENQGVYVTATLAVGDEEVVFYEEEWVGSFNVFWQVVETFFMGDLDETLFSGNTAQFRYEMVNNSTAADNAVYESLFYNLIIENAYNGYDYVLASQQGISVNTFDVQIPPFITSDRNFVVRATEGGPIAEVGTFLEDEPSTNIFAPAVRDDWFQNFDEHMDQDDTNEFFLIGTDGFRELVSKDVDLSAIHAITFQYEFDEELADLTANQVINFEFSTDEGATWTNIETLPSEDYIADDNEKVVWIIPAEAKTQPSRFRIRQEDSEGDLLLIKMRTIYIPEFPFEVEEVNVDISAQNIQITGFGQSAACSTDEITIDFAIQGAFGADAMARVQFETEVDGDNWDDETSYLFPIAEGATSGSIMVTLPSDDIFEDEDYLEDAMFEITDFAFSVDVRDETWSNEPMINNTFYTYGDESTTRIEIVNPILADDDFLEIGFSSSQRECDLQEIFLEVYGQQGFQYQAYDIDSDPSSPTLIGDPLTLDWDNDNYMISFGEAVDPVTVGVQILAQSSDGSVTCGSLISEDDADLIINPIYELYRDRDGAGTASQYVRVADVRAANLTEEQCTGEDKLRLRTMRIPSNATSPSSTSNVEWYRTDGTNNFLVGSGTTFSSFVTSGAYFGRVTDGDCVYDTRTIPVVIHTAPAQPDVTVASGNLLACEGNVDVQLEAPTGFNFYLWSTGETTRTINVDDDGSYTVQVSNISYDLAGCVSPSSIPVVVEEISSPEFGLSRSNGTFTNDDRIGDGAALNGCEGVNIYFYENFSHVNNGIVTIVNDATGEDYASTNGTSYYIRESGTYYVEKRNDDLVDACTQVSGTFTINVFDQPEDIPLLTSVGALSYCEGEGSVELTAPAGFAFYHWYLNGSEMNDASTIGFDATDNTRTVTDAGIYSVRVGTASGCESPQSNSIEIIVKPAPSQMHWMQQEEAPCGPGSVAVRLYSGVDPNYSYQLYDRATGLPSGDPVDGTSNNNTILMSDPIDTYTEFYVVSRYADGSGTCETFDPDVYISVAPNNVVLELDEASLTLDAVISGMDNAVEIKWFRNNIELVNKRGDYSLTIADNANYSIEVTFAGGCIATDGTIDDGDAPVDPTSWVPDFSISSVYPNPAENELTVEVDGPKGMVTMVITNITGQIVYRGEFDKNFGEVVIPVSVANLETGIYNLTIFQNGLSKNGRLVKK